jgi:hypothetical protein
LVALVTDSLSVDCIRMARMLLSEWWCNFLVIQTRGGSWSCDFIQVSYARRGALVWSCCALPRWAVSQKELQATRLSAEQLAQPTVAMARILSLVGGFEGIVRGGGGVP